MFRPVLITPPADLPVTVEECKLHGVIDSNDDDGLVETYIGAATGHLDGFRGILGRCIVTQTWQLGLQDWFSSITLPVPDVSSVSLVYDDEAGDEQSVDDAMIRFAPVASGTMIYMVRDFELPSFLDDALAPVRIQFTAGYGNASAVPKNIKLAIMEMARQFYDDRGGEGELSRDSIVFRLIAKDRWVRV